MTDPVLDHIIRKIQERRNGERRTPAMTTTPEQADKICLERLYTGVMHVHWQSGRKKYCAFDEPPTILEFK